MKTFKTVLTTCGYCGCGCGLYLEVLDGQLVGAKPCKTDSVSQGGLCIKKCVVDHDIKVTLDNIVFCHSVLQRGVDDSISIPAGSGGILEVAMHAARNGMMRVMMWLMGKMGKRDIVELRKYVKRLCAEGCDVVLVDNDIRRVFETLGKEEN